MLEMFLQHMVTSDINCSSFLKAYLCFKGNFYIVKYLFHAGLKTSANYICN